MDTLRVLDALVLLLCASMYLGIGVALVVFLFPIAPKLTPATYQVPFVGPVATATRFLTVVTIVMLAGAVLLIVLEAGSAGWVAPAVYLAAIVGATVLTQRRLFPINRRMAEGIGDPDELQATLGRWRRLNTVRAGLWAVTWLSMAVWFGVRAAEG